MSLLRVSLTTQSEHHLLLQYSEMAARSGKGGAAAAVLGVARFLKLAQSAATLEPPNR